MTNLRKQWYTFLENLKLTSIIKKIILILKISYIANEISVRESCYEMLYGRETQGPGGPCVLVSGRQRTVLLLLVTVIVF